MFEIFQVDSREFETADRCSAGIIRAPHSTSGQAKGFNF